MTGWEGWVDPSKDSQEVCFECQDGPLGSVPTVHIGRDELVGAIVGACDGLLVGCAGFIIQDVVFACHDGSVGWDVVHILL